MKHNPDDRSNNVERIQCNINHTLENISKADEMIENTSDEKMKETLKAKNERREEALSGLRNEIQDEAMAKKED